MNCLNICFSCVCCYLLFFVSAFLVLGTVGTIKCYFQDKEKTLDAERTSNILKHHRPIPLCVQNGVESISHANLCYEIQ